MVKASAKLKDILDNLGSVPDIFFDPKSHSYTDSFGNTYTSVTTLLDKYGVKFDKYTMAKLCEQAGKRGNPKYVGKTAKQLLVEWARITNDAIIDGNEKHDFLEQSVKSSNGYKSFERFLTSGRIYTIADIIDNPNHGVVDLDYFIKTGVKDKYPLIFNIIEKSVLEGYRLYPEVCTYSVEYLISGLVDLLMIKDDSFIIGDWKTNKYPLMFKSGYFEKDKFGLITDNFIEKNEYFKYPLESFSYSNGNKYTLQLSLYSYLTEGFNLKNRGCLLFHINKPNESGVEVVKPYVIKYLKDEVARLLKHHKAKNATCNSKIFNL